MSSTSDKKPEFLFANCKQCEGIIRIPITARPDSSLSCPHCDNRFQLASVLDQQVPEVNFVDGSEPRAPQITTEDVKIDTGSTIEQQDGKFVVPAQLSAGIKKRRRRRKRSSSQSSGDVASANGSTHHLSEAEENEIARRKDRANRDREKLQQQREAAARRKSEQSSPGSRESSSSRRSSSRRQSSKRSPLLEALKIGIGGLLAIPIAYLLLMWIFSRDPLQLAPTIHGFAPSLVPSKLIVDESTDLPGAKNDSMRTPDNSLPVPETDPDDIDPSIIDLNL